MFLTFWISIGSMCLSSKQLVSIVVDSYESTQKFIVQHGKSLHGLIHLVAQLHYIVSNL